MTLDFGLKDVHVLITGASGGIGIELTRTFLQLGAQVLAQYNSSAKEPANLRSSNLSTIQADMTQEAHVETLFDTAETFHLKPVQILIVNHGIWPAQSVAIADMSLSQWRNTHRVDLDAAFLLCGDFLRRLRGRPSALLDPVSICFTGSTAGKFGEADHGDYASAKSALMYGLTLTLKNEIVRIAPRGRVNIVSPGWVRTPMAEQAMKDEQVMVRSLATTPLQKVAEPGDVAKQVAVISSPVLSGHVTGC
ncbi:hypothetical protein R6Q59_010219 [Mikania micrantha]